MPPRGLWLDWRIHCGVEVTELSTNKQHTLSIERTPLRFEKDIALTHSSPSTPTTSVTTHVRRAAGLNVARVSAPAHRVRICPVRPDRPDCAPTNCGLSSTRENVRGGTGGRGRHCGGQTRTT
jgi:hypothetical protein